MNVEIITIGDEILIGQIIDTNSAWIGQELNKHGFEVNRITSISDKKGEISSSLTESLERVDIVLLTGGLGPTRDDITKHVLCDYFDTKLVFNETVYNDIVELLKGRVRNINDLNRNQAMVPEKCTIIRNPVGTAPIMWFEKDDKIVVSMPGVPSEMKHAMIYEILPKIAERFVSGHIIHKTVHIYQIPEAVLAEMLAKWEDSVPDYIKIAYLPQPGRIRLRLTARGKDPKILSESIDRLVKALYPIVGDYIYGFDEDLPEELVGKALKENKQTLSTAESCSGGAIASMITSIPGASTYFKGSVVAYENMVKQSVLGVKEQSLINFGAVSKEVVEEMALGIQELLGTDWSVATSGIAGPTGGTEEKPVGTVWIAVAKPDGNVISKKYSFGAVRERNIKRTSDTALMMLLNEFKLFK